MPRAARNCGRLSTVIQRKARPAQALRSLSKTRSSSASPAPNSACAETSRPTTSPMANSRGAPGRRDQIKRCSSIPTRPSTLESLSAPTASLKTWNGDQWKIGGGSTWGWYSYDPDLNLIYYGTANPSTSNPVQRAGPTASPSTRSGRCRSSLAIPIRARRHGPIG